MKIINIVDDIRPVNFGIWSASIITAQALKDEYQVDSQIWYPAVSAPEPLPHLYGAKGIALASTSVSELEGLIQSQQLSPVDTVICTHGSWRYPTKWGAAFRKLGFVWVYVPQGMLEPWSMAQKAFKKQIYFQLIEGRLAGRASMVRAVSTPEGNNLRKLFPATTTLLPNSVPGRITQTPRLQDVPVTTILFMARLHHKKGIIPLVEAWLASSLNKDRSWQLLIAGPDDGELPQLKGLLAAAGSDSNVKYIGAVYKEQKSAVLESAQFYILPTMSEGFPTSVVEAMQHGLIPIMSDGANFPEAFEAGIGIKITQSVNDIVTGLEQAKSLSSAERSTLSMKSEAFIQDGYVVERQVKVQNEVFSELLRKNVKH